MHCLGSQWWRVIRAPKKNPDPFVPSSQELSTGLGEEVGIQYPFPQGPAILTSDLQVGESLYRDSDAEKQRRNRDDEVTLRHPQVLVQGQHETLKVLCQANLTPFLTSPNSLLPPSFPSSLSSLPPALSDKISLYSFGWPRIQYIDQSDLNSQSSACFFLSSTGMKAMSYHAYTYMNAEVGVGSPGTGVLPQDIASLKRLLGT